MNSSLLVQHIFTSFAKIVSIGTTILARFFGILFFVVLFPVFVFAQDVTVEELEKAQQIRERLIQEGYLQESELPLPNLDIGNSRLMQYASYMNKNRSIPSDEPRATHFRPDGRRMYVVGRMSRDIREYHLSVAWDVSTASYERRLDILDDLTSREQDVFAANGLYLSDDGNKMWVFNRIEIWEYTLSSSWDITTANPTGYKHFSEVTRGHDFDFKPDGRVLYIDDRIQGTVFQYDLNTAWDVESADLDYVLDISAQQEEVRGTQLSPEGDKMFNIDTVRGLIFEYYLPNRFDLRSASYLGSYDVRSQTSQPTGITFKPDFTRFYVSSGNDDRIYQYKLSIVDEDESRVTSDRRKVVSDGNVAGRISVTARDDEGDPINNVRITLRANNGNATIDNVRRNTSSSGVALFDVKNSTAETVTFSASGMGIDIDETVDVEFVTVDADESSVTTNREKVIANGTATARIIVTARDEEGDVLQGVRINLDSNRNSVSINNVSQTTNSDGEALFDVSSSEEQTATFTAEGLGVDINETVTVRFAGVDAENSAVTANREKVLSNGNASGRISVVIRDEDGDELADVRVSLNSNSNNVEIANVNRDTNSDGEATFNVSNNTAEPVTFTASGLGTTINQTVRIRFVTVDPNQTMISVSPENVQADDNEESVITVITRDEDGDELEGARVVLEALNGNSEIDDDDKITNSDGVAEFNVKNSRPEIVEYTVTAENIELPETITVGFIPVAPVALSANNVGTRSFMANWEVVSGAQSYVIDVAVDSSFNNTVNPYDAFDVGNITSFRVENISPGTTYLYRVRATSDGLIGANSQVIQTTTFPDVPVAQPASDRNALRFTANWQDAEGARNYRLDVARDSEFNDIVGDYENHPTAGENSLSVTGLVPGESYFYRVRSEAGPRRSAYSDVIETSTLTISSEQSAFESEQLRVLANGSQSNTLEIVVKSDEGILLDGLDVQLIQTEGNSQIESVQPVTNDEGVAVFAVSSQSAGKATYEATAAGIYVGEVSVEFLQDEGVLKLGDNYPNPFSSRTILPVTVPRPMTITLTVFNSLGVPVRTVVNEEFETGYYEIPFESYELAAGVYFYRLIADDELMTEKMVLIK